MFLGFKLITSMFSQAFSKSYTSTNIVLYISHIIILYRIVGSGNTFVHLCLALVI